MNKKHKRPIPQREPAPSTQRWRWITVGVILVFVLAGLAFLPSSRRPFEGDTNSSPAEAPASAASDDESSAKSTRPIDPQRLVGRWLRPDGGYILEVRKVSDDGTLEAGYFNPRPIKVARAEWQQASGKLQLFVELRDVGYPGSTYSLECDDSGKRLAGNYFQAAQGEDFPVEFVREE